MNAVIAAAVSDELTEYATAAIAKIDAANEKRRAKNAEKAEANQTLIDALVGFLGDAPLTATDLLGKFAEAGLERIDGKDFNVQFVSTLARKAVEQGKAGSTEVAVKGKGKQKGYTAV